MISIHPEPIVPQIEAFTIRNASVHPPRDAHHGRRLRFTGLGTTVPNPSSFGYPLAWWRLNGSGPLFTLRSPPGRIFQWTAVS